MKRRDFMGAGASVIGASFFLPSRAGAEGHQSAARPTAGKRLSSFDPRVREWLAKMTLEEKIGQMTQAEQEALKDVRDIETYFLGSLLSGGSSDPKAGNSLQAWTEMYESYQSHAVKTRLSIPLLFGIDAVHGHNNVLGATVFPHNIGLGCTRNPGLVEKASRITAVEVRATGINWAFAPCVAVPRDERWGRTYEGFGEDPELARVMGDAAVRGLQGADLADPLSVLSCVKHFIGDGGTSFGTGRPREKDKKRILDQGDTQLSEAELRRLHLPGYLDAIKSGAGSIMPSYSSWNGVKLSASKRLMQEILKDELGFEGFLISDYRAIDQITPDYKQAIEISINAGMDMVMVPHEYVKFFTLLRELVNEGRVPMARIDDAVTRILRVKAAMGLLDAKPSITADRKLWSDFGSTKHREIARQCVRESLVVLKNANRRLPLRKDLKRVHVAGRSADDIGNQCGGWTISWQGKSGEVTTGGTTILAAIRASVSKNTEVTFSRDGAGPLGGGAKGADAAIVVLGETPYAEGGGDTDDLNLAAEDLATLRDVKATGVPVIGVLVSGRPMILGEALDLCDSFIAAWLPGTEGRGVTDVVFGDFKPTGKLSMTWPRSMAQLPINAGDAAYDPLFPNGFGLSFP
jgi:beta-glucosidase